MNFIEKVWITILDEIFGQIPIPKLPVDEDGGCGLRHQCNNRGKKECKQKKRGKYIECEYFEEKQ